MSAALLLVDIQNDYFPGGAMELEGAVAAGECARALLAAARARDLPVFHVQHVAKRPGATFFLPGTRGVEIHPSVQPAPGEKVITKHFPNSFRETGLQQELRAAGVDQLIVAGMMTHMCIDTTVRAAADLGFAVTLAQDACATREQRFAGVTVAAAAVQTAFLAALDGSFAAVKPTSDILAQS